MLSRGTPPDSRLSGREEYGPEAGAEAEAQLRLRYRLSALTADEYAKAGFTAVVQDVVLGKDLRSYVASVRTRPLYVVVTVDAILSGRDGARVG
ncbi:hypothetical protein STSP_15000 [Streptomyces jeddahensis]|uniref:Uncharacterized protein n=1 Tax=Streptomyces jeddahensis TaxID=1716141 RepID=A0A177HW07_9ACTN|nr:hypothetical protein STSP_15000 [Streptomyces jeddahensis]